MRRTGGGITGPLLGYVTISGTVYPKPLHGPNPVFCFAGEVQYCQTQDYWPGLNYTQTQTVNLTGPQIASWSASVDSARGSDCSSSYFSATRAYELAEITTTVIDGSTTRRSYIHPSSTPDPKACCGAHCFIKFPNADVLYFPSAGGNTATVFVPPTSTATSISTERDNTLTRRSSSTITQSTITSQTAVLPRAIQARVKSLVANDSNEAVEGDAVVSYPTVLVSDGYTFYAPSIYIIFHEVWASDLCGIRGTPRTAITLGFGPGELSTLIGPTDMPIYSSMALNPADLPCPTTWRPGVYGAAQNCKPLIAPPQKLLDVDPLWHNCEADHFQGLDPPKALVPAVVMDPAVTVAGPGPKPTPADPGSVAGDPGPQATKAAGNGNAMMPWPSSLFPSPLANTNPSDSADPGKNGGNNPQPSNPQPVNPQPANPQSANPQPVNPEAVNTQAAHSKPADSQAMNPQFGNSNNGQSQNQGNSNQGSGSGNSNPQPQQYQGSGSGNPNSQPQQNQADPNQGSGLGNTNPQPQPSR
ncbi:MAG: hypothetical protein M1835_001345, partial [Candelina submexicana]